MTDDPRYSAPEPFAVLADDDTEGCLCLVVGYAKADKLIARVTAETERQVMMSPALGDVVQLRYVDLGPQPGRAGDRSRPVRRIVAGMMAQQPVAGRSHFALIVIAKSAVTIEELAGSCAVDPFLAELRIRFVGIASSDDRQSDDRQSDDRQQESGLVHITSSPTGTWRNERELVEALRRRCEELPPHFAASGEPGLTQAELAALRQGYARHAASDPEGGNGLRGEAPAPDVLDDEAGPDAGQGAAPADSAGNASSESAAQRPRVVTSYNWRPGSPRRWRKQTAKAADPDAVVPAQTAMALVYLLMVADRDSAADPAHGRLQGMLLDVDRKLAAQPFCGFQVRLIHGSDGYLLGELQDAGKLGRRTAKRSVKTEDFTAVLKSVRGALRRDCELVQTIATAAGVAVASPTVIMATVDPPMASLGAAAEFRDLAAEATVVWVVPGNLECLVSPAFGAARGAVVLGEHQAVADEILAVMNGSRNT